MSDKRKDPSTGENPAGALTCIALERELAEARSAPQWTGHDRSARSLVKHRDLTVTLLLLRKGARLAEHQARGSFTLQVLEGTVSFNAGNEVLTLEQGSIAVLEREVPHSVEALADSALLLTAALPRE